MRRMRFFASRNAREILRDPISVGFGVVFPILLLLLLSFLNRHIPAEAHMMLFEPEQLAPGVSVFSLSFLALFSALLRPVTEVLNIPTELMPLILLRPLSGSGSVSYVTELYSAYGADSVISRLAAILSSSTETTFYAAAVYFSGRGYKTLRYTIPAALCGDLAAVLLTLLSVRLFG